MFKRQVPAGGELGESDIQSQFGVLLYREPILLGSRAILVSKIQNRVTQTRILIT
jgi:hypothetical protein